MKFDLVFVLLWEDAKIPLVRSQTFDQAQRQTEIHADNQPDSVEVFILAPFRSMVSSYDRSILKALGLRCPGVRIRLIPGVNRIQDIPMTFLLRWQRRKHLGRVVFHFRSESSLLLFSSKYRKRERDVFVLDVRGYWPAELLYRHGVEDVDKIPDTLRAGYTEAQQRLEDALGMADGVVTVSGNLASLLKRFVGRPINIVPCSVKTVLPETRRKEIRKELGVSPEERLIVYSGGYARYQHLEDLTIPFMGLLMSKNSSVKGLILSQDLEKIREIVNKYGESERFIFLHVPQDQVGEYLSACDLGLLLRRPTLVNTVAQPVKVGEYLAAGVPVCVEGQVGGVTDKLLEYGAGICVNISGKEQPCWDEEAQNVLRFLNEVANRASNARQLAEDYFLWDRNIPKQRNYYQKILSRDTPVDASSLGKRDMMAK